MRLGVGPPSPQFQSQSPEMKCCRALCGARRSRGAWLSGVAVAVLLHACSMQSCKASATPPATPPKPATPPATPPKPATPPAAPPTPAGMTLPRQPSPGHGSTDTEALAREIAAESDRNVTHVPGAGSGSKPSIDADKLAATGGASDAMLRGIAESLGKQGKAEVSNAVIKLAEEAAKGGDSLRRLWGAPHRPTACL